MTAPAELSSAEELAATPLTFRAGLRLAGLGAWTAAWASAWGLGAALGAGWSWTQLCRTRWARGGLAILGVRRFVAGALPRSPYLVATNHLSYLDILVLSAELPVRFVAKAEVARWPVWGPLARWTGTLFLDRTRTRDAHRVARAIADALERGESVVIFPEGTSSNGETVLPFRPALFEGAITSGTPVVPAALSYRVPDRPEAARTEVCWWGAMTFVPHLIALADLPRIEAHLALGALIDAGSERQELARRAHATTTTLHRSIIQKEGHLC